MSNTVEIAFVAGRKGGVAETVEVDLHELPDDIKHTAMLHGIKQKLADAVAAKSTDESLATAAQRRERVKGIINAWLEGNWTVGRSGGAGAPNLSVEAYLKEMGKAKSLKDASGVFAALKEPSRKAVRERHAKWVELKKQAAELDIDLEI